MWENAYFFPTIDRETFAHDMKTGDVDNSLWCTPFLVNSICAHRSQTLGRAKLYSSMTRQSVVGRFLDQAESALKDEQGRVSIPTAQALMIRYFTMACMGRDRVGRPLRQQAIDMVRRLNLEAQYKSISGASPAEMTEQKRISKALWGLFLVESQFAYFYLQPSQIPPPGIPRDLNDDGAEFPDKRGNVDVLGRPFETSPCEIPLTAGILSHVGKLSELLYEVTSHNTRTDLSRESGQDVDIRKRLYARLRLLDEGLPHRFSPDYNSNPSTIFLRMYLNEVGFAIIQDQSHRMLFGLPANQPGTTIKDVSLLHTRSDIEMCESYLTHWPFEACLWRHLHLSLQPLVLMLDGQEVRNLFTSASAMMRAGYNSFRVCGSLLQATEALVWAIGEELPEEARPYYEGCREHMETQDLPLSFALPRQDDARKWLTGKSKPKRAGSFSEEDLGSLIEAWTLQ